MYAMWLLWSELSRSRPFQQSGKVTVSWSPVSARVGQVGTLRDGARPLTGPQLHAM